MVSRLRHIIEIKVRFSLTMLILNFAMSTGSVQVFQKVVILN